MDKKDLSKYPRDLKHLKNSLSGKTYAFANDAYEDFDREIK